LSREHEQILDIIKKLISTNGYLVEQKGRQKIKDKYFDTKDAILKKKKVALRLRTVDEKISKITLKIPKKGTEADFERVEIEKTWSHESFNEIMNALKEHFGGHAFEHSNHYYNDEPEVALANANFQKIQERETDRNLINALNSQSHQTEFEFAIDKTHYHLANTRKYFSLMELEIELKKSDNYNILHKFVNELVANQQSIFKLWPHSKLVTGKAIEILLSNKELEENRDFDNENFLTLSGLEKVDSFIKASGI